MSLTIWVDRTLRQKFPRSGFLPIDFQLVSSLSFHFILEQGNDRNQLLSCQQNLGTLENGDIYGREKGLGQK